MISRKISAVDCKKLSTTVKLPVSDIVDHILEAQMALCSNLARARVSAKKIVQY